MNPNLALKHAVLRALWSSAFDSVGAAEKEEISRTLEVSAEGSSFLLRCKNTEGAVTEKSYPKAGFSFFARADRSQSYDIEALSRENENRVSEVVKDLLGAKPSLTFRERLKRAPKQSLDIRAFAWPAMFLLGAMVYGWNAPSAVAALIALLTLAERSGRRLFVPSCLLVAVLPYFHLQWTTLGAAAGLFSLAAVTHMNRQRLAIAGSALAVAVSALIGLSVLNSPATGEFTGLAWLCLGACTFALAVGWVVGTHICLIPVLVAPLCGVGLCLDGYPLLAGYLSALVISRWILLTCFPRLTRYS